MKTGPSFVILLSELKRILKRKNIKYSQLAAEMGMSESTIKRLMSSKDAPLSKVEAICDVAGITLFDLVTFCQESEVQNVSLTEKQERFFKLNTHFFYFFSVLYEEKISVAQIKKKFGLNNASINKYLKKLEELGLLERHSQDKIVWKINGPISLKHETKLSEHVLKRTLTNFADIMTNKQKRKLALSGKKGESSMGDFFMTPETAERFMKEKNELMNSIQKAAMREERIFGTSKLVKYSIMSVLMPLSLYYEDIPNI
jgi:DNA-binding Xre family transcriptional regulator/predicted transcriptional regulator